MKSRRLYWVAALVAVLVAAALYFGPHWTVYRMRKAIEARDATALASQVDFPALKESVKAQLMTKMSGLMNSSGLKDGPLAGVGQMLGTGLINQTVDALVTPTGVMLLMQQGKFPAPGTPGTPGTSPPPASKDPSTAPRYALDFLDFSTVEIRARDGLPARFVLRRHGVFFWKLSAVELPM
ncbi:DUF2939 domain-containing protein [Variovorax rhizosphaerae]|uniref:DUF2939 domain-containing protein n=1 Tax=Variovorax rhizosphaerae TaxID=1836200 RepID=A0ABU8WC16_9BURK